MIQVENRRPTTSMRLESSQRGTEMNQHHSIVKSQKQRSALGYLIGVPLTFAFRFIQRVLNLLLSGFIISIYRLWGKVSPSHTNKQPPQNYTIEPVKEDLELRQATELEDQFITVASHELRTPMTTISGHTQLLLRRLARHKELSPEMAVIRTALESIDGQTRRLNAVVNELLELSNIRAGNIGLHRETCNLSDICHQVVEQEMLLSNRKITLIAPTTPILLQARSKSTYPDLRIPYSSKFAILEQAFQRTSKRESSSLFIAVQTCRHHRMAALAGPYHLQRDRGSSRRPNLV